MRGEGRLLGELFPAQRTLELGFFAALVFYVAPEAGVVFVRLATEAALEFGFGVT